MDIDACDLERWIGVDSSFGKNSSRSSSAILEESLFSTRCRMLGCLRRGLMVPRIEVSVSGVSCKRLGARLVWAGRGAGSDGNSSLTALSMICFAALAAGIATFCRTGAGAALSFVPFTVGCWAPIFAAFCLVCLRELCAPGASSGATAPLA